MSMITLGYIIPIFLLLILVEYLVSRKKKPFLYHKEELWASLKVGAGAGLISLGSKFWTLFLYIGVFEFFNPVVNGVHTNLLGYESFGQESTITLFGFDFMWVSAPIWVWLLCQLADDFCYYWVHRANHEVRVLWAAHIVHHSSHDYNYSVGVRNGWFTLFYKPLFYLWMPMIGFHWIMCLVCLVIESIWQFQLHSQYIPRLGFFEHFMNSHKHHHVHHSSDLPYLDKNHGGYLNIFDKLFGTFKDLDEEKDVHFGVLHPPKTHRVDDIVLHEYRNIWKDVKRSKTAKEALMYVFGPPGWSPDGSTKTVKQLQREMKEQKLQAVA